ncbi:MAG TPA: hypothetical protein VFN74_15895 [Chloroflexota bacterium]|nr:hypothetical protein [Chloroflexota bacterium]
MDTPAAQTTPKLRIPYLVDQVRTWTETHIRPGQTVYDREGVVLGQVVHVHEGPLRAGSSDLDSCVEVRTRAFDFGRHVYVPFRAISDVTPDGIFLREPLIHLPLDDWNVLPVAIISAREEAIGALPDLMPSHAEMWERVRDYYWKHWAAHYGVNGLDWAPFEHRFRFAWEMGRQPEYARRGWQLVQGALRTAWEALHADDEWDQAAEMIRDAWELRRASLAAALAA